MIGMYAPTTVSGSAPTTRSRSTHLAEVAELAAGDRPQRGLGVEPRGEGGVAGQRLEREQLTTGDQAEQIDDGGRVRLAWRAASRGAAGGAAGSVD